MGETRKRKRPSAKETRERMARAAASNAPITRAEEPSAEPPEEAARKPAPEPRAGTKSAKASPSTKARSSGARGSGGGRNGGRATNGTERGNAAPVVEGKLTRLSVDVPRSQHVFLRVEAAQAGTTGMAVVRALISEMQDDAKLARRVRDRLAGE